MKKEKIYRSPLFYVGDKYKIINEIKKRFPKIINRFIEPFVGGGSVFLNIDANEYLLNDIDSNVINIHKFLCSYMNRENEFFDLIFNIIEKYNLSFSLKKDIVPEELKLKYRKTYFAHFNKENYNRLKEDYNSSNAKNVAELYVLLIYGFNRMLRFNGNGNFNVPVGNVDFNNNTYQALKDYFRIVRERKIIWYNLDYKDFLFLIDYNNDDFIYLDPPYLITFSEYNKLWNEKSEIELLNLLDDFNNKNIKFAISNVTYYKGKENHIFNKWASKYNVYPIKSNYISYHDNTIKQFSEVLVTNY
ncbi:MAG: adenine methylase [Rikenellaceae bacterium]|nr:adenine methylase [Rikenellaceae bacterium]